MVCRASLRLTAGSHGNGGTRRQELAQPLPTGSLRPPNILILTPVCPGGDGGTLGSWTQPQFTHLLLRKCSKSVPFGGPPGGRKESDYRVACPHPNPQAQQCPPCPVPAWRKLGRENGSKRWGKDSGPVMSTGRPRLPASPSRGSAHRTAPGKHPGSARATLEPRLPASWPWGLRWQGWRRSRSGGHRGWTPKHLPSTLQPREQLDSP